MGALIGVAVAGLGLCAATCWSAAQAAPPSPVHHYVNARFGFSVDLPPGLIAEPEPTNGDGRAFHAPDGGFKVTASGSGNALEEDLKTFVARDIADCAHQPPDYLVQHRDWTVFSCKTANGIDYQKTIQSGRGLDAVFVTLRIRYPADQQVRWQDAVARASTSLRLLPTQGISR